MSDIAFVLLAVAFFALAVLFVRACESIAGEPQSLEEKPRP